ncbi:MAG: M42 family metallopeptidase [Oscillospiraceae bacterium]|nr:M42 family metallopeptidase [Oscillospiraceae bacterium]
MIDQSYAQFAWEKAAALLAIDSPSGFTDTAAQWVKAEFEALGFPANLTNKGGVLVDLGGKNNENGLMLAAHADTLGAMVCQIKGDGRLKLTPLGGMNANNAEAENVRIYTREGKVFEGTAQLCNASVHVNGDYSAAKRSFDTLEVVLDEDVSGAEAVKKLGIQVGDMVCFDPRTHRTASGYLKSRFLDDKLSVGILLGFAKCLCDSGRTLPCRTWIHVTVYEEVGHGGSSSLPEGVTEAISVDMGCVGSGLDCTERMVSICAKDSGGPYTYEVVGGLISAAKAAGADYAVDVYPYYGSDVEATLRSGADIRHGLIGPGVYASHGYERSHMDGVLNTLKLLWGYVTTK